jgi:hypothetical protein
MLRFFNRFRRMRQIVKLHREFRLLHQQGKYESAIAVAKKARTLAQEHFGERH